MKRKVKPATLVGIVMGSESDLRVMQDAIDVLRKMKVSHEVQIMSASRDPERVRKYAKEAINRHVHVIIAGAGLGANLAGAIAAHTRLPIIGVPIKVGALNGVDALYSTVQMPPGVPVMTVAINGAKNAAFAACEILALLYPTIGTQLEYFRAKTREELEAKSKKLKQQEEK